MDQNQPDKSQMDDDPQSEDRSKKQQTLHIGRHTTFDITSDAEEVTREYEAEQERRRLELQETGHFVPEGNVVLHIEIQGAGTPLMLPLFDEALIGRRDPDTETSPELDLTPYGAYQMGISRRHALFKMQDNVPVLIDLASRNGTYLNGKKLPAHQPTAIHDGDAVRVGKISMTISIEVEPLE